MSPVERAIDCLVNVDMELPTTVDDGRWGWDALAGSLDDLRAQRIDPRGDDPDGVTLFKSVGVAFEDLAVAKALL